VDEHRHGAGRRLDVVEKPFAERNFVI